MDRFSYPNSYLLKQPVPNNPAIALGMAVRAIGWLHTKSVLSFSIRAILRMGLLLGPPVF